MNEILPRGAQRGTEVELRFIGDRLGDAEEIMLTRSGVEITTLTLVSDKEVKAIAKIAPDCPLGARATYVRARGGISGVRLFTVGALKEIQEAETNHPLEKAQKVELDTTINGIVEGEDVDYYSFEGQAGQRINFEVEGLRLASSPLDPALTLYDPSGREIGAADDTALLGQDCHLGLDVKEAGVYTVSVREASYGGGGNFYYRLHLGTFPRPVGAFPPGGKPGAAERIHWLGEPQLADEPTTLPLQVSYAGNYTTLFPTANGRVSPSEVPVRVNPLNNFTEAEPNNSIDKGTSVTLPAALNGIISEEKDIDFFKFDAKKGQVFDFQLYGRRIRSPLDSVVIITKADGAGLTGDDDAAKPDSYFRYTIPEDGVYGVYVKDHLDRGGPNHFYRLEVMPVEPALDIVTYVPGYLDLQSVPVAAGNRNAVMVSVRRKDMGGAIKLEPENLPPGVKIELDECPDGIGDLPMLLSADEGTTPSARFANLVGRPADENVKVEGRINQNVELVRIVNNIPIMIHNQRELPMAVMERVPFKIEIIEPKVPIVKNGVMSLIVKAVREGDYNQPIDLRMLWNPPGIGSGTAKIDTNQTTTTLALNCASNAPTRDWKIAVIGAANVGNSRVELSTQLAKLSVADMWIGLGFEKARTEQGKPVEIVIKPSVVHEYQGEATIELVGLPNKVTAPAQKITKETTEIKVPVDVPADAPPGKFDGVFARATVFDQGEPIVHQIGGAELRIDKPLPPKVEEPAKKDEAKPAAPPPPQEGPKRGERKPAEGIAPFKRGEGQGQ